MVKTRQAGRSTDDVSARRLLVAVSGDLWAGAAVQVFNFLAELVGTRSYELLVVTLNESVLVARLRNIGITVRVLPEYELGSPRLVLRLRGILRDFRPTLIHLHEYKLHVLLTVAILTTRCRIPIVRTIHSRPLDVEKPTLRTRLVAGLDNLCLRFFTKGIVAVSDDLREYVRAQFPSVAVWMVRNALYAGSKTGTACGSVRERFGVPETVCWIGAAMRLEPVKNPMMLLRTASELKSTGASFVLSVFGTGALEELLLTEASRLGLAEFVRFHGHHADVADIMCCWDVFVLTSLHEGLPMSLLEAMFAGVPPVCTAVGGIPEVVTNEVTGLLVPSKDEERFKQAVWRLIDDVSLRRTLGQRARAWVIKEFSTPTMVGRYLEVYEHCLAA